jgi:predicted exporter
MKPRKAIALLAWAALLGLCVLRIVRTTFIADLSAFLPADPDPQQRVLIEQLQAGLPARTMLLAIEGGDAAARAAASRALAQRLRESQLFEQVNNGDSAAWGSIGSFLFEHRYLLSPAVNAERYTAAGLRDGIGETLSLLGTPAGNAIKPILEADPTGETLRIGEALIPVAAPRSVEGVWASRASGQAERALLLTITRAAGADLDAQQAALVRIEQEFATLQAPGLTLKMSGAPLFGVQSRALIEREIQWLSVVGTGLMCAFLWLAFGSLRALAVAALPVVTGVLAGITAVSLAFGSVHAMTLAFGTTLIGEAVDYAIYYLIQARAAGAAGWLRHGWPTVRLGLLTSVCGFAALVFSGFPGLQQLGVFSVAGLVAAAMFTRFVMPELMPHGAAGRGLRQALGSAMRAAIGWLPRLKLPLLALGVAAAVLLVARGDLWRAELSALSPLPKEMLALDASLRADLSAGDAKTLVVASGADLQATLQRAEAASRALDGLADQGQGQGRIAGHDSITRWLPSEAVQRERQAALPAAEPLRAALAQATAGGPLRAERLAPFVDAVQRARGQAPVTLDALRAAGLGPVVDALLLQRPDGSWVALLPLSPPLNGSVPPAAELRGALAGTDGLQVIEIGSELTRLYERYLGQAQLQSLLGAVAVLVLIALTLRNGRRVLAVCQPLLLAVLLTMGLLAAFGVQLGILHLVGLLLVVAVGSNYALFFDMLLHEGDDQGEGDGPDSDTLASLALANLTTVASFGLIALSALPALAAIGTVVGLGSLLALVLAAAFAPTRRRREPLSAAPAA